MFDVGFSELLLIGVVALVVLGPERLPKVARTAGHLFGRLQRYVATVKADLNREMDMSELAKVKQEVQDAARAFEQSTQEHARALESEANKLGAPLVQAETAISSPAPAASDQAALLMAQEEGLAEPVHVPASAPVPAAVRTPTPRTAAPPATLESGQGTLDFGIEPVRIVRR